MRTVQLALLLLAFLGTAFAKDKRAEAEALFVRANALVGIGDSADGPYRLTGHFRLFFNAPVEGNYLSLASGERNVWRHEVTFPGYSEIVVRNGDRKWVYRNLDYTPVRVAQLHRMLDFQFTLEKEQRVAKITEETIGATHANCVKTEMQNSVIVVSTQFCVDKGTGLPLRKLHSVLGGLNERLEYEDYIASGGKQFPRRIRMFENDKLAVEFWLDSLSTQPQDESSFAALPNAVMWPVCENMKHPVRIHTPDPAYTDTDRKNRVQGTVVLQMVVDTQGKPANIAVARSLSPGLDKEAQKTVSGWRFRPAMCGDTPVPTEMNIEVSFRLYN